MHCSPRWGRDGWKWAHVVQELVEDVGATTVLDYGCGKGVLSARLSSSLPQVIFYEYDPGIKGKEEPPTFPCGVVACTDVMEHVEPQFVEPVLAHIRSLTAKRVLFVISLRPAKALLPDGSNAHLTLQPAEWWLDRLEHAGFIPVWQTIKPDKELVFVGQ